MRLFMVMWLMLAVWTTVRIGHTKLSAHMISGTCHSSPRHTPQGNAVQVVIGAIVVVNSSTK